MNRDEYAQKLSDYCDNNFDAGMAEVRGDHEAWNNHFMQGQNIKIDLIEEYEKFEDLLNEAAIAIKKTDKIMVELDRLRWHYPERGELPERKEPGEDISVIYEHSFGQMGITTGDHQPDAYFFENRVIRWRYIE